MKLNDSKVCMGRQGEEVTGQPFNIVLVIQNGWPSHSLSQSVLASQPKHTVLTHNKTQQSSLSLPCLLERRQATHHPVKLKHKRQLTSWCGAVEERWCGY